MSEKVTRFLHLILFWLGNILHTVILLLFMFLVLKAILGMKNGEILLNESILKEMLSQMGINEIFTFIGAIAFILFGMVGIYEFEYLNGLRFLVPPAFAYFKEKTYLKQAETMMELYYKRDIDFIQKYEKERTDYLLQAMGLDEKQFMHINYEIIKARTRPSKTIDELKQKARTMLLRSEFIIDQTKIPCAERVYDKVDYFFNLYTALYKNDLCKDVGEIMNNFLFCMLGEKVAQIDYVVIPQGSNFLLGLEVGKLLHKPIIAVRSEARIYKNVYWDGKFDIQKKNKIIVIHDVLVSGKRIYESIEKFPKESIELLGIYSLVKYNSNEFDPIQAFKEHHIKKKEIHWLLEVDEKCLKGVLK